MERNPHRAPGRLAPYRHDYERGTPVKPPPIQPPVISPPQLDRSVPDYTASERLDEEEVFPFDSTILPGRARRGNGPLPDIPKEESPPVVDDTQPRPPVPVLPPDMPSDTGRLSIQERHQLLIHTIQLHERDWKLAGIRANPKNDRLQAYLLPINTKLDLKEAISKNRAMIITIDPRGNTEVREPKKPGVLKRIINWLVGE